MRLRPWWLLLAVLAVSLLVRDDDSLPAAASPPPTIVGEFVPGEVLVGVQERLPETIDVAAAVAGARPLERIPSLGVFRIGLPPGMEVAEAMAIYQRFPWVHYAEPNYVLRAAIVPNDTLYGANQSWYYELLEGPAAWDVETGDRSIIVAALDTGIDLDHPDLDSKIWANTKEIAGNGKDDDGNGCVDDRNGCNWLGSASNGNVQDDNGHGTMVGGIVGVESNNARGVVGTAWGATLMPVKVLNSAGNGNIFDVAEGIVYAAENGARVLNMSLAGRPPPCGSTLGNAINEAHDTFGATLVAASGNDGRNQVACPAAHSDVIAVGASGGQSNTDKRASFSNWGRKIDVVAPGVDICSTFPPELPLLAGFTSIGSGNRYACGSGTSFSTPLVSGLAALILSRDRFATNERVRFFLCASAVNLPDAGETGWDGCGRINMLEALPALTFVPGISRD